MRQLALLLSLMQLRHVLQDGLGLLLGLLLELRVELAPRGSAQLPELQTTLLH
jgi:hypothetical protein